MTKTNITTLVLAGLLLLANPSDAQAGNHHSTACAFGIGALIGLCTAVVATQPPPPPPPPTPVVYCPPPPQPAVVVSTPVISTPVVTTPVIVNPRPSVIINPCPPIIHPHPRPRYHFIQKHHPKPNHGHPKGRGR